MRAFLSFHRNQADLAHSIQIGLVSIGIDVRVSNLKRLLNDKIFKPNELSKITNNLDYVIVIISNDYLSDPWLPTELNVFKNLEGGRNVLEGQMVLPVTFDETELPEMFFNKTTVKFNFSDSIDNGITELKQYLLRKRNVFIVMKFNDAELELVYRDAMRPALEQFNFQVNRINEVESSEKISPRIVQYIDRSDIILCDLTGERPNCYYETGYAQALSKTIILTAKKGTNVHFDLNDNNIIFWENASHLKDALVRRLDAINNNK